MKTKLDLVILAQQTAHASLEINTTVGRDAAVLEAWAGASGKPEDYDDFKIAYEDERSRYLAASTAKLKSAATTPVVA
jgi:hypothetical protein